MGKSIWQSALESRLEEIKENNERPSLLLHSCCGPCSSYVLTYLREYFDITVYYYDPNIYPQKEYEKRLSEQKRLIDEMNKAEPDAPDIILEEGVWDHDVFLEAARGFEDAPEGGKRCEKCFRLRLESTAELARSKGFDYFATTLTVSPHKNAVVINEIGGQCEQDDKTRWLASDFKKRDGYKQSIELSKKYGLYRQDYCGCEFSMHDDN